jgi:hypothetical protein
MKFHAGSWLRHHRGYRVTPNLVMLGRLMRRCGVIGSITFDEYKAAWIILLFEEIEPKNPWLLIALERIGDGCLSECLDTFRFNMDVDVDEKHQASIFFNARSFCAFLGLRFVNPSFGEWLEISRVTGLLHFFHWDKAQGSRIDAIPQVSRAWPVIKQVT